jgi:hypothetical protein
MFLVSSGREREFVEHTVIEVEIHFLRTLLHPIPLLGRLRSHETLSEDLCIVEREKERERERETETETEREM